MPIDINEDRRLRVTWLKYQNIINDMNNYFYKKKIIKDEMDVNMLSRWEAGVVFEEEIRKIEQKRREEMNVIRKAVRTERKICEQEDTRQKLVEFEEKRIARKLRKTQRIESPPPLRRSARLYSKTLNDP